MSTPHGPMLVIANPRSGDGRGTALAELRRVLEQDAVEHTLVITRRAGQAVELTRDGIEAGARFVVAVGGDGTVHEVVNGMVDAASGVPRAQDLVLGAVPGGSGSDFLRSFGLDVPVARLVRRHLLTDTTMPLDLGRVHHLDERGGARVRLFANIAECGWGADVVATANRLPRRIGSARYLTAILLRTARLRARETTLRLAHTELTEPLTEVVVANGQFFGSGIKVAPRALTDDGILNVQAWRGGRRELLANLPRARVGEHLSDPSVREWQSPTVEVDAPRPLRVEADGEVLGTTPARFDVLEHVLRLSI